MMWQLRAGTDRKANELPPRPMLRWFHLLQDTAHGYRFTQLFGYPTIRRYHTLVQAYVPQGSDRRVLEIGCGTGSAREWFSGVYTGIDINPEYIRMAQRTLNGTFRVMDGAQISFPHEAFDDAVSIATAHHLSDDELSLMVMKAVAVAHSLHLIDAILPISPYHHFKRALFRMDRGRHVRTFDQLRDIVGRVARVESHDVLVGPLHDVCYLRVARLHPS